MNCRLDALLAAERLGRLLIRNDPPRKGEDWKVDVMPHEGAWLAGARWADRYGANVRAHLSDSARSDPVCAVLAEPLRRLGLLSPGPLGSAAKHPAVEHPESVWSMSLSGHGALFARRAGETTDPVLSVEQTREIDRKAIEEYALPGVCLMENAAIGAAMVVLDLMKGADWKTLVAAGGGNNAGDGLAVARGLALLGKKVAVAMLKNPERLSPDAAANYGMLRNAPACAIIDAHSSPAGFQEALGACDLVIDALLGTGFSGELAGGMLEAAESINRSGKIVVSLDLPSGMSGNLGIIGPAVKAARTVAFGNLKPGLLAAGSRRLTGDLYIAEIGAPGAALAR